MSQTQKDKAIKKLNKIFWREFDFDDIGKALDIVISETKKQTAKEIKEWLKGNHWLRNIEEYQEKGLLKEFDKRFL